MNRNARISPEALFTSGGHFPEKQNIMVTNIHCTVMVPNQSELLKTSFCATCLRTRGTSFVLMAL